jgi:hypothetical protein
MAPVSLDDVEGATTLLLMRKSSPMELMSSNSEVDVQNPANTISDGGLMQLKRNASGEPCACRCGCCVEYSKLWRKRNDGSPVPAYLCTPCWMRLYRGTGCG